MVLLFYEASTRTRTSFEFAAKALGATTTLVTATSSSIEKGESLIDTGWTVDCARRGRHRHAPSQQRRAVFAGALRADADRQCGRRHAPASFAGAARCLTILNHKKKLKGLRVVIVGDVYHSRVARSNAELLSRFGAEIIFCGPPDFVPEVAATLAPGVVVCHDLKPHCRARM